MTFDCSLSVKVLAVAWIILPLAGALIMKLFIRGAEAGVLQENSATYLFMALIGGSWMLLGLALVPLLGVHGWSLAKVLMTTVGWSAAAGAWWGPTFMELRYQPPRSAIGEAVDFLPTGRAGHMVKVSPISGDAASVRFLVPQAWWNEAYARAGNRPIRGRVYKGGRNLWFARFD